MADSSSSSDSSASGSDFANFEQAMEGEGNGEEVEPFMGIQLWRFEPPGRNEETVETEERSELPRRRYDLDSEEW